MENAPGALSVQVGAAFAEDGALAGTLPAFETRNSQRDMAVAAAEVFESPCVGCTGRRVSYRLNC